jgi:membrane protease YdiL (CAAX protease family)
MIPLFSPTNHLFELARRGKRLPHIIVALVMTLVFVLLAQFTGGALAVLIIVALSLAELNGAEPSTPEEWMSIVMPDTALEQTLLLVLGFGPIFLVLWAWLALVEKRPLWTIGMERRGALFKYVRGLLVGLLLFGGAVAISAALGFIEFEQGPPQQQGLPALGGVLLVLAGWVVQGAAEEALTRGWLLPVIGARYKAWLGVLLSSVIFAVLHSLNPNLSLIAMLNLFLFGFFAALYALYEGGLWGVFSIHTIWNWLQGNVLGFEVSGNLAPGGTLFNLREVGPDVITGGAFGPEGGLAVTVALLAGIAGVIFLAARGVEQPGDA